MSGTRCYLKALCCFAATMVFAVTAERRFLQSNPEGGNVVASRIVSKQDPTLCVRSSQTGQEEDSETLFMSRCGSNDPLQLWRIDLVDFAGIRLDYQPGRQLHCLSYREDEPGGVVGLSSIYCDEFRPAQKWRFSPEGRISMVDDPEWCLDLNPDVSWPVSGATLFIALCDPLRATQEFVVAPRVPSEEQDGTYEEEAFTSPALSAWIKGENAASAGILAAQETFPMTDQEVLFAGVMMTDPDINDVILSVQCSGDLCSSTRYEQGTGDFLGDMPQLLSWLDSETGPQTCPEGHFVTRVSTQGRLGSRYRLECKPLREQFEWCSDEGRWTEWFTSGPGTTSSMSCHPEGNGILSATSDFVAGMDCQGQNCTLLRLWCQKICAANSIIPASKNIEVDALDWVYIGDTPGSVATIRWTISGQAEMRQAIQDLDKGSKSWLFLQPSVVVAGSLFRGDSSLGASKVFIDSLESDFSKEVINYLRGSQGSASGADITNACSALAPHMWVAFHTVKGLYPSVWSTRIPVLDKTMCTANYVQPSCPFSTCMDEDPDSPGSSQTNCRKCCVDASLNVEECGKKSSSGGYVDVATQDVCFPESGCEPIGDVSTARGLMLQFKDSHDAYGNLDWAADLDMCSEWEGVSCNSPDLPFSIRLALPGKQLSGTLPRVWSTLPALDLVVLTDNQLTGALPEEWNKLTNLKILDLRFNCLDLEGGVPAAFPANAFLDTQDMCAKRIAMSAEIVDAPEAVPGSSSGSSSGATKATPTSQAALSLLVLLLVAAAAAFRPL